MCRTLVGTCVTRGALLRYCVAFKLPCNAWHTEPDRSRGHSSQAERTAGLRTAKGVTGRLYRSGITERPGLVV